MSYELQRCMEDVWFSTEMSYALFGCKELGYELAF